MKKVKLRSFCRALRIWVRTGEFPNHTSEALATNEVAQSHHEFSRGAAEQTLPILQDDAIRTTLHLLFRPGFMMRDYLQGKFTLYLSPLTALLIYFSLLTMTRDISQPDGYQHNGISSEQIMHEKLEEVFTEKSEMSERVSSVIFVVARWYDYLHLDSRPDLVDTSWKGSLAAIESTFRSQGITAFLSLLLIYTLAFWLALRPYHYTIGQSATITAFFLCQFAIFCTIAYLVLWGRYPTIENYWLYAFIFFDLWQFLGCTWKKALVRTLFVALGVMLVKALFVLTVMGVMAVYIVV